MRIKKVVNMVHPSEKQNEIWDFCAEIRQAQWLKIFGKVRGWTMDLLLCEFSLLTFRQGSASFKFFFTKICLLQMQFVHCSVVVKYMHILKDSVCKDSTFHVYCTVGI